MSSSEYKRKARESTEARVREKDATAASRRNAELDAQADEALSRERCPHPKCRGLAVMWCGVSDCPGGGQWPKEPPS